MLRLETGLEIEFGIQFGTKSKTIMKNHKNINVKNQIWFQILNQVGSRVLDQVLEVRNQVSFPINQIKGQVINQFKIGKSNEL